MATSLATSLPMWLAGATYDSTGGNDLRQSGIAPFFYQNGVSGGGTIQVLGGVIGGKGLVVTAAGGLTVNVTAGSFVVPNTASPVAGGYAATLAQSGILTLASADPSNPRIDIVAAGVTDNGNSSSSGWVQVVTGTPAGSPSVPAAPANSIVIGTITVPAGATTITNGNITENTNWTTAAGGVLVCQKSSPPSGYFGQVAYDWPTQTLFHNSGQGQKQLRVLPFAPVFKSMATGWTLSTTPATIPGLSATVTCDGQTDLKITYSVAGFTGITSAVTYITVACYIDGVLVEQSAVRLDNTTSAQGGVTGIGYTDASLGNTPSSGSHTVTVQAWSSSGAPQIHEFSGLPAAAYMRVEPVSL